MIRGLKLRDKFMLNDRYRQEMLIRLNLHNGLQSRWEKVQRKTSTMMTYLAKSELDSVEDLEL